MWTVAPLCPDRLTEPQLRELVKKTGLPRTKILNRYNRFLNHYEMSELKDDDLAFLEVNLAQMVAQATTTKRYIHRKLGVSNPLTRMIGKAVKELEDTFREFDSQYVIEEHVLVETMKVYETQKDEQDIEE